MIEEEEVDKYSSDEKYVKLNKYLDILSKPFIFIFFAGIACFIIHIFRNSELFLTISKLIFLFALISMILIGVLMKKIDKRKELLDDIDKYNL